ncbi:hypothetical protein [Kitasatospora sp. MAP5-34]|uniref:hypothetical protein n=1 Tax=Kitasatospora sp. MAP5-34 TaxID=3035102 RepID=UPI00247561C5|nr:hypothetical protein [Kitasatospora sp. MAP5-34]MDH6576788.1 hypothetical protein [Kitasatospora sp. MAP5-34]
MLRKTSGAGLLAVLGATMLLGATAPAASATEAARTASDASLPQPSAHLQNTDVGAATGALGYAVAPLKTLRLDPFAQSSADVLNNGLSVEPDSGVPHVSTTAVTGPLSGGGGVKDLAGIGPVLGVLPG